MASTESFLTASADAIRKAFVCDTGKAGETIEEYVVRVVIPTVAREVLDEKYDGILRQGAMNMLERLISAGGNWSSSDLREFRDAHRRRWAS